MSANGKKILIVEDEAVAADNLREFLEENGYTVLDVCNSGEDAVNKATKNLPDLVLMDIKLQGDMDGVEAAIRINKKSRVPIIYLTAFGDDEKVARAKAIEPPVFIPKPYSLNDVLNIIGAFEYEKEMDDALNLAKKAREVVLLAEKKVTEAQIKAGKAKRKLQFFTHTTKEEEAASGPKCFIVHGHDDKAKLDLKNYLQNTLKFPEPLVLHELPSIGKNIIEKFEDYAKDVDLVFVLLTPDDKGCSKKRRTMRRNEEPAKM